MTKKPDQKDFVLAQGPLGELLQTFASLPRGQTPSEEWFLELLSKTRRVIESAPAEHGGSNCGLRLFICPIRTKSRGEDSVRQVCKPGNRCSSSKTGQVRRGFDTGRERGVVTMNDLMSAALEQAQAAGKLARIT